MLPSNRQVQRAFGKRDQSPPHLQQREHHPALRHQEDRQQFLPHLGVLQRRRPQRVPQVEEVPHRGRSCRVSPANPERLQNPGALFIQNKHNILHRDLKLANILKSNGYLKIADFGFSRLLNHDEELASTMLGSPLNMAPEVLNGNDYGNKADIWSIGTVFYELLYGRPPYTAGNMIDLLKNIKSKPL